MTAMNFAHGSFRRPELLVRTHAYLCSPIPSCAIDYYTTTGIQVL